MSNPIPKRLIAEFCAEKGADDHPIRAFLIWAADKGYDLSKTEKIHPLTSDEMDAEANKNFLMHVLPPSKDDGKKFPTTEELEK